MAAGVLDKLNKVKLWQKALVVIALSVGIVVFFVFNQWKPLEEKALGLNGQLQDLDRRYKEQKAVADDLTTFQQNTKKLEDDLRIALTQLPREKEIPSLLRDIYTLGKKSGVDFKTFQPQGEANKKLYAEVPIKITITGSYHEVAVFFDRVGKLSRIVNISELDMTSTSKDKQTSVVVNCTATTFMFLGSGS